MPGRGGNGRGRGRGGHFKINISSRDDRSVMDRLGGKAAIYPKGNDRTNSNKYRSIYSRPPPTTPSSIASLPPEAKIRVLSKKFLKSYYEIFDQPGRPNLESQYSADSFFSFSATYPPLFGRNLLEVREANNRVNLLIHDKKNIATTLASFSPTEHLVNFLSSDIPFYIVNPMSVISMQIIVTGVFKDTSLQADPLKAFTRVFVIKQASFDQQGEPVYEIYNDLFMLQPPTPDQIKRYHSEAQIVKKLSSNHQQDRPNSSNTTGYPRSQDDMLKAIMLKTKMNKTGSRQLLQDCEWDEKRSIEIFNQLFSENRIPQDFFTP